MPKIIYPDELPVYENCVPVGRLVRSEYLPKLEAGELRWSGTRRRASHLHVIPKDNLTLKGEVPTGKRFSFLEHLGEARVWQHSRRCVQPCPDRNALLTGQVMR